MLDFSACKPIESKVRTSTMDLQILMNGPNWMLSDRDVDRPIGGKDKYGHLSISPRNARERVHGCDIAPMQVFENNHPRSFGGQALHEITEFAKHAFPCGSEDLMVECGTILFAKKSRHLRQPCRRVFAKRLKQGRSIGSAALFVQRLDQRQESLMGSEQFVATTAQHAHRRAASSAPSPSGQMSSCLSRLHR